MKTEKDLDKMLKGLSRNVSDLEGAYASSGWDTSQHPTAESGGVPLSFSALAHFHEYGGVSDKGVEIPARKLFFHTLMKIYMDNAKGIKKIILTNLLKYGKIRKSILLQDIADFLKSELETVMGDPTYLEDNAESTIGRKGANTPLVETGSLRANIITQIGG